MRSSNPIFASLEKQSAHTVGDTASKSGIATKTFLLAAITIITGFSTAYLATSLLNELLFFLMISGIVAFIAVLLATFIPKIAAPMSILYAVSQGIAYGTLTWIVELVFPGIAVTAMVGTAAVFIVMLVLYNTGLLRGSSLLRGIVLGSLIALLLGSLVMSIISLANPGIYTAFANNFEIALIFTLLMIVLGAFMLTLDFDRADRVVAMGLDKYYEWVVALGFMITLIWIYVNILRLLILLASRNR